MMDIPTLAALAAGGALGAVARFQVSLMVNHYAGFGFPWGTLAVNIAGSLIMGIAFGVTMRNEHWPAAVQAITMAGFLGAFTTFSTYSLELYHMLESGRWWHAGGYAVGSVTACIAALALGVRLVRLW